MGEPRKNKSYTPEFRESSAKLAAESGQPVRQIADELGVHETTLSGWVTRYYRSQQPGKAKPAVELQAEVKRLNKELARVKEERDILKKATAYFAKLHE